MGLDDHAPKIRSGRFLQAPCRSDGVATATNPISMCARRKLASSVVARIWLLFRRAGCSIRGPSRPAVLPARRKSANCRIWAVASASELPRPTRISRVSSGDTAGCPTSAARTTLERQAPGCRVAAQRGTKLDFDAGIAGDRRGPRHRECRVWRGRRKRGPAALPECARFRPPRRRSTAVAIDGSASSRKQPATCQSGLSRATCSTKYSELGQTDRIARAMANDQQSVPASASESSVSDLPAVNSAVMESLAGPRERLWQMRRAGRTAAIGVGRAPLLSWYTGHRRPRQPAACPQDVAGVRRHAGRGQQDPCIRISQ